MDRKDGQDHLYDWFEKTSMDTMAINSGQNWSGIWP